MKRLLKIFLGLSGIAALVYGLVFFSSHHPLSNISIDRVLALRSVTVTANLPEREPGPLVTETKPGSGTPSKTHSKNETLESQSKTPSYDYEKAETSSANPTISSEMTSRKNGSQKYLIFVCDRRRSCGGWGDRQRGLVGTFALSLVTGRQFGVIITVPCNLTHFYTPNEINWVIPDSQLKGKSNITIDDMNSKLKITGRLKTMDFNKEYPQDVVYVRNNAEYWLGLQGSQLYRKALPVWAQGSKARYFVTGWTKLMTPSVSLQRRLKAFQERINFSHRKHPLVCAHVRVGRSATFKRDTVVRCNISDLPVMWDFVDQWVKNGSHVFLATDSWEVRNLTRQRFGDRMYDSGGQIVHVDQQARMPNACEGFESALLDQLILTQCDVLITSHSIFSQRASYLRNRTDNLFSFLKGKIKQIHI